MIKTKERQNSKLSQTAIKALEKLTDEFYFIAEAVELIAEVFKNRTDDVCPPDPDNDIAQH